MEITYQKTKQLNMDIISFKRVIGIMSLLLLPSGLLNLIANFIKRILFWKLKNLSKLLKENQDIFQNEYYDCLEINDMIKYTLNRNNSLITATDLNFINSLNDSFFELILYKLNLLKDNHCEFNETFFDDFNIKYDEFTNNLIKSKEYFYNNIYSESYDKQDIIDYLKVAWE